MLPGVAVVSRRARILPPCIRHRRFPSRLGMARCSRTGLGDATRFIGSSPNANWLSCAWFHDQLDRFADGLQCGTPPMAKLTISRTNSSQAERERRIRPSEFCWMGGETPARSHHIFGLEIARYQWQDKSKDIHCQAETPASAR